MISAGLPDFTPEGGSISARIARKIIEGASRRTVIAKRLASNRSRRGGVGRARTEAPWIWMTGDPGMPESSLQLQVERIAEGHLCKANSVTPRASHLGAGAFARHRDITLRRRSRTRPISRLRWLRSHRRLSQAPLPGRGARMRSSSWPPRIRPICPARTRRDSVAIMPRWRNVRGRAAAPDGPATQRLTLPLRGLILSVQVVRR